MYPDSPILVEIALLVASWIVSGVVTITFMKTKILEFDRRLTVQETDLKQTKDDLSRYQVETAKDIATALARSEVKP